MRGNNLQDDKAYNFIAQETKIAKEQYQAVDITKYKDLESIKNKHSPKALEKLEEMLASHIDSPRFASAVDNNLSFGNARGENIEGPNIRTTVDNNLSFGNARGENAPVPEVSLLKRFLRSKIKQIRRPIERGEQIATENQRTVVPKKKTKKVMEI